jgi:hypothetical protein
VDLADLQSCYGTNSASSLLELSLSINSLKEGQNRRVSSFLEKAFYKELLNLSCIGVYVKVGCNFWDLLLLFHKL